jgi:hypothetical protein
MNHILLVLVQFPLGGNASNKALLSDHRLILLSLLASVIPMAHGVDWVRRVRRGFRLNHQLVRCLWLPRVSGVRATVSVATQSDEGNR